MITDRSELLELLARHAGRTLFLAAIDDDLDQITTQHAADVEVRKTGGSWSAVRAGDAIAALDRALDRALAPASGVNSTRRDALGSVSLTFGPDDLRVELAGDRLAAYAVLHDEDAQPLVAVPLFLGLDQVAADLIAAAEARS